MIILIMKLFNFGKKPKQKPFGILVNDSDYSAELKKGIVKEQVKGLVDRKQIKFPEELGEEHPFDSKEAEEIYKKFGIVSGAIDKYVDWIVTNFYIDSDDKRAKQIIEDWIKEVYFHLHLKNWVKEALIKPAGYMELGGNKEEVPKGVKVLDANHVYIQRDKYGNWGHYGPQ